MFAVLN